MKKNRSLSARLLWQIAIVLCAVPVFSITVMCIAMVDPTASQVPRGMPSLVAESIRLEGDHLVLDADAVSNITSKKHPEAWVLAADSEGRTFQQGNVPAPYIQLGGRLQQMLELSVSAQHGADTMAARLETVRHGDHSISVLLGGVAENNSWTTFEFVIKSFGIWVILPSVAVIAVGMPWVIRRALGGVRRTAQDAGSIDVGRPKGYLNECGVPSEILPIVHAFNGALDRIGEAAQARDRFLLDAAHELRMPIAVLATRIDGFPQSPAVTELKKDLARLENIAEQLLDLQRIGSDRHIWSALDLRQVCRETAEHVAPLLLLSGYEFSFNAPSHPVQVRGDSVSLGRVITALLQNALMYGGGNGEVSLTLGSDGLISVSDEGPGIPYSERRKIFAPFYRLGNGNGNGNGNGGMGTGLGLHLAKEIVERHGGTIRATEAPSGGACMMVSLPVLHPATTTGVRP